MSWLAADQQQAAIHFVPKPALNRDGLTMHGDLAKMALNQRRIAPIHNLPVELLSRIFLLGYSDGVDPSRPFKRKAVEGLNWEVIMSHVCRHWREVALKTPALWTSLRMRKPSHLDRGRAFAQRSRNCRIDVMLDFVAMKDHKPGLTLCKDEFHEAFDVAETHSMRWRSFLLRLCDLDCKAAARARLHGCGPVPQLESLQLWHLEEWGTSQNLFTATAKPPVKILNGDVPSLVNVSLVGVNLAWSQEEYLVALKQIEFALHSEGVRPSVKEWETLLRDSPNLERLSLHYSGPRIDGPWSTSPIELRALRELSFIDMDPDVLCTAMEHLSLPALRVLELELPEQDFSAFLGLVSNAEAPYFPLLDTLRVSALDCSTEAWSKFLLAVPKLSFLETDFRRVQHDFFQILFTEVPRNDESVPGTSELANQGTRISPDPSAHSVGGKSVDGPPYNVLLPSLAVLKVAGLPAARLLAFVNFRRTAGYPTPRFMVHNKLTAGEMSALEQAQVAVEYYQYSDDEDEEEEEDEDEDIDEDDEDDEDEEDEEKDDDDDNEV